MQQQEPVPKFKPQDGIQPKQSRMTLANVEKGKIQMPPRVLIWGTDGVGKSTFAAHAPAPIFLAAEEGTANLDVARLPRPETWQDVLDAVRMLTTDPHDYSTFCLDTVDAIEPMCWRVVCEKATKRSTTGPIEEIEQMGYGRGYVAALDEWRVLLAALEQLWTKRKMGIILVGHSIIKPFKNPEGDDYDRFTLTLHDKAAGLIRSWTDCNLFARVETFANKDQRTKRVRGISSGARILQTQRTAAFDAKNRYDLPETLPLDYQAFADAVAAHQTASPAALIAAIETSLTTLADETLTPKVRASITAAAGNAATLAQIHNKLAAMVSQKETNNG